MLIDEEDRKVKVLDRTISIVLLLLGIGLFLSTFSEAYDIEPFMGDVGTVFMPRVYFVIWIGLSIALLVQSFRRDDEGDSDQAFSFSRLCIIMLVSGATAVAILKLGFVLGMAPGFFIFCWLFGYRKPVTLAIFSIAGTVIIWVLFNNVFELPLPRSPWFNLF
ncbi:MAG: tripartite tricarboxylate transporter TctB family protein [Desulfobacterales bacterium]|nr:tripartite tricarboxylate transporter TctB family protein [Desulfobacterales bacterium]